MEVGGEVEGGFPGSEADVRACSEQVGSFFDEDAGWVGIEE